MTMAARGRTTKELAANSHITVYFCDPHRPWQCGTTENTNGLVRQYVLNG